MAAGWKHHSGIAVHVDALSPKEQDMNTPTRPPHDEAARLSEPQMDNPHDTLLRIEAAG